MNEIKQAVILAGGLGTRLRPLTLNTPKPMLIINGKPFLLYILELLKENKIKKVIFLTGYLHKKIENYFGNGKNFGLDITYSYLPSEAETGTRIRHARKLLDDAFILLYGDNYWPLQLWELEKYYRKKRVLGLVTVFSNHDKSTKNNILVDSNGFVQKYDRSRKEKNLNGVDIGFFILNKKVLNLIKSENSSFEEEVIKKLIKKKQLVGFVTHHKYYGLSTLERIPILEKYLIRKKVVFLDRDGVINKKPPKAQYVTSWKEFKYLPEVKHGLKVLAGKGYQIFIVSNQAGIARGIITQKQVYSIHAHLRDDLRKINVHIKDIYICPHGWDEGCFCRKPNPGMFFKAASEHAIDLYSSYCIGDDTRDMIAGQKAGCKTFLVDGKNDLYSIVKKLP